MRRSSHRVNLPNIVLLFLLLPFSSDTRALWSVTNKNYLRSLLFRKYSAPTQLAYPAYPARLLNNFSPPRLSTGIRKISASIRRNQVVQGPHRARYGLRHRRFLCHGVYRNAGVPLCSLPASLDSRMIFDTH